MYFTQTQCTSSKGYGRLPLAVDFESALLSLFPWPLLSRVAREFEDSTLGPAFWPYPSPSVLCLVQTTLTVETSCTHLQPSVLKVAEQNLLLPLFSGQSLDRLSFRLPALTLPN